MQNLYTIHGKCERKLKFNNNSNNNFSLISKFILIIIIFILTIGSIITLYLYFSSHGSESPTETLTAKSIAAGLFHNCVLLSNHSIMCWGYNWYGQLGDGTKENRYTPVPVQLFS
ncbi:MAG: hypothetical protein QXW35_04880 [Candidatus Aenigmatarchaeota archaeon]